MVIPTWPKTKRKMRKEQKLKSGIKNEKTYTNTTDKRRCKESKLASAGTSARTACVWVVPLLPLTLAGADPEEQPVLVKVRHVVKPLHTLL